MVRGDERVHAGDVRVHLLLRPVRRRRPRRARGAAEADRAQKTILRQRRRAQHLRQPAVSDAALQLHLPQPILRVHVAEAEERVRLVRREDVRDGVGVADDVDRRRDAGDRRRAGDLGQRAAQVDAAARRRNRRQQTIAAIAFRSTRRMGESYQIADFRWQICRLAAS